jgi:hypothetical protein
MSDDAFIASLPRQTAARARALRERSRGERSAEEWAAHRQRMAEIQTNLAIENMPLSQDELAFFDFAFALNVTPEQEDELLRLWNLESLGSIRRA